MKPKLRRVFGLAVAILVFTMSMQVSAGWEAFAAQLESLGWTTEEDTDGSLRLYPPSSPSTDAAVPDSVTVSGWDIVLESDGSLVVTREPPTEADTEPTAKPPARSAPPPVDPAAQAYLESLGWQVERAEDGSVLLFPPGSLRADEKVPPGTNEEHAAGSAPATGISAMDTTTIAQLRDAGWQVEHAADGSILLFPPSPARTTEPAVAEPPADVRPLDEATIAALRDHGWTAVYADDGSILLYPPRSQPAPRPATAPVVVPAPSSTPVAADTAPNAELSDESVLDLLEQRGWTVERTPDGSLLLFPQGYLPATPASPPAGIRGACAGHSVAALSDGRIAPPLDDLSEVRAVAENWAADSGLAGVAVGRVRQILRIYVVSIVDAAPPHRLRHQIAIRRDDGTVILLT